MADARERYVVQYIEKKLDRALNREDGGVSAVRQSNFDRYYGKPIGNEKEGYSGYVSRQSFEVVEWALSSLLRVLIGGGRKVVEFDAVGPEDEKQAEQETAVVNYWLLKRNKGFLELYCLLKAALMDPVAYAKVWLDVREVTSKESYSGLLSGQVDALLAEEGVELLRSDEESVSVDGQEFPTFSVQIERTHQRKDLTFAALPPDEVLVDRELTSLDMDEADFVCHRAKRTHSELLQMGISEDDLYGLATQDEHEFDSERTNRLFYEEENPDSGDEGDTDGPGRTYWVHEIWGLLPESEDDEVGTRRYVLMVGHDILQEYDMVYQPIVAVSAIPMPFKHTGMSYIETVADIEGVITELTRQLLDNIHKVNIQKKYINRRALGPEGQAQLVDPESEFVSVEGIPQQMVMLEDAPTIIAPILETISKFQEMAQMRSGVAPQLSLDPNVLRHSTEGGLAQARDWSNQRLELLVRMFAEAGLKPIMLKAHQVLRQEQDIPQLVKLAGDWVEVNPSEWRERTDMTVQVGLGNESDSENLSRLQSIYELQKEAQGMGLADLGNIYHTLNRMASAANVGSPYAYFIDPNQEGFQPPEPATDPAAVLAEAEVIKAQSEAQTAPQKVQADVAKAAASARVTVGETRAKMALQAKELALKEEELRIRRLEAEAKISQGDKSTDADVALKGEQSLKARVDAVSGYLDTVADPAAIVKVNGADDLCEKLGGAISGLEGARVDLDQTAARLAQDVPSMVGAAVSGLKDDVRGDVIKLRGDIEGTKSTIRKVADDLKGDLKEGMKKAAKSPPDTEPSELRVRRDKRNDVVSVEKIRKPSGGGAPKVEKYDIQRNTKGGIVGLKPKSPRKPKK